MIARVIQEEYEVTYHPGHVRKLLQDLGFSVQRPREPLAKGDPIERNCSGVGQTSGLPVHGASGSVNLMAAKLRARGPVNRQTRGLPHTPT
jgi:hypothetical protein